MYQRAHQEIAHPSIGRAARQALDLGATLWTRLGARLAEQRQRQVAAALYAALSGLSDAELECRVIARKDLRRFCASRAFSAGVRD